MLIAAIIAALAAGIAAGTGGAADPFREVLKYWTKAIKKLDDEELKERSNTALAELGEVMERIAGQVARYDPAYRRVNSTYASTLDDYGAIIDALGADIVVFQTDALDVAFKLREILGHERFEAMQAGVAKDMTKREKKKDKAEAKAEKKKAKAK